MSLKRRSFLGAMSALVTSPLWATETTHALVRSEEEFSLEGLHELAKRKSREPYHPMLEVPAEWRNMSYDEYRKIRFDIRKGIWTDTDLPFHMDFFHPGLYFPRPVQIAVVEGGVAKALGFDINLFDTTASELDLPIDATMGYSGFRLRTPLVKPGRFDEFMVFQGASYFRSLGATQNYGLSARAIAVNTAEPDGEEFPDFTHFWVETPRYGDNDVVVHALLDGPSMTGIYTFTIEPGTIEPGAPTVCDVKATIHAREELSHVGLAPLTSMFFFDETNRNRFDDFRPAVHDSEGLMVWNGSGELLWRPLANPKDLQVSSFFDENPRGFGLMQRSRDPEDFADFEAHYHNRPSLWIKPGEDWGKGAVTLVEIPASKEIYDNIVAYWRPHEPLKRGAEHSFTYKMFWGDEPSRPRDVAQVMNTRIGKGFDQIKTVIAIDYAPHPALEGDLKGITRFISVNRGEVSDGIIERNPGTGGVRLVFSFLPGEAKAAEFRVQLVRDKASLTEVFLYRWTA